MTHILIVDSYDSFIYNLVQYVGEAVSEARGGDKDAGGNSPDGSDDVFVHRNDALSTDDVRGIDPDGIVVSSGPGIPAEAGVSALVFRDLDYPTLSICLGHRSLCAALENRVGHAPHVVHGKPSLIEHNDAGVFSGLPDRTEVGRYHSFTVEHEDVPPELAVAAYTIVGGFEAENSGGDMGAEGDEPAVVMGVHHREKPHIGVQLHPESILTDSGRDVVRNFIALVVDDGPATAAWEEER